MKHPFLTSIRNLNLYFVGWASVALVHVAILTYNQNIALPWSLIDGLMFNLFFAAAGLGIWYPCKYISIENDSTNSLFASHLFGSVVISLTCVALSETLITRTFAIDETYKLFLSSSFIWRLLIGVFFYFFLASFYYMAIYSENLKAQAVKRTELTALVQQAELNSLRFQINPHFIFNSLNSINSLTQTAPEKAGEMTVKLADFLRYTLSTKEKQKNSLAEELNSARLYLDIEKVRFGDKLAYVEEVEEGCLEQLVPNTMLQPLIENAIKYGVYESTEPVTIHFKCKAYGDYLNISVENNFDPEAVPGKGEGIGLSNIASRLQMMYDQKNLMEVHSGDNTFKVNLYIPFRQNGKVEH